MDILLTPHKLAKILRNGTDDIDLFIDITTSIGNLSKLQREFITLYASGYSATGAVKKMNLKHNPGRLFNQTIKRILSEVNRNEADSTNGTNVPDTYTQVMTE